MTDDLWGSLGTREVSIEKALVVLFIIIAIFLLNWASKNVEGADNQSNAFWYYSFGLIFISFFALQYSFGALLPLPIFQTIVYENNTYFGNLSENRFFKYLIFMFCMWLFFCMIFVIQLRHSALISAPTFQAVPLGAFGGAGLTFLCAVIEAAIFVGLIPSLIYGFFKGFTGSTTFAIIAVLILSPSIFTTYHVNRYGFENMIASTFVFLLNLTEVIWVFIFRNILFSFSFHGGNNVGLQLFKEVGIGFDIFVTIGIVLLLIIISIITFFVFFSRQE